MDDKEYLVKKANLLRNKAHKVLQKSFQKPLQQIIATPNDCNYSPPTRSIFICGCGAGSNITSDQLSSIFSVLSGFSKLHFFKSKPYSVVTFHSIEDASHAYVSLNNKLNPIINKVLILEFSLLPVEDESQTPSLPPGLTILNDFVTEEEENYILQQLDEKEWIRLSQRYVQHYGYAYRYETNDVDPENNIGELPEFTHKTVIDKLKSTGLVNTLPDQLTVNKYKPGSGIPPHVDTHSIFEEALLSLSLESPIVMEFRHPEGAIVPVVVPRRSLMILKGEARYVWSHGIAPRKTDLIDGKQVAREERISLTFRTIRRSGVCQCNYNVTWQCDTWLSKHTATRTEQKYVYETYSSIANHFASTRHTPWPKIAQFLAERPPGSLICDIGCGNGRYLGVDDRIDERDLPLDQDDTLSELKPERPRKKGDVVAIGMDTCKELVEIAKDRGFEVGVANCLDLPFRSSIFDCALSIAVIHHLSTEDHRLKAINELYRVLKIGGLMMVYVWAFEQEKRNFKQQDIFVPWKIKAKKGTPDETPETVSLNATEDVVYQRFYHIFKKGELETLISHLPGLQIVHCYYDKDNWALIAKKVK